MPTFFYLDFDFLVILDTQLSIFFFGNNFFYCSSFGRACLLSDASSTAVKITRCFRVSQ